jgi:hypothetical protein
MMTRRELIIITIRDLVEDFLGDDRKEDEELPRGAIEDAVAKWDITIGEMALVFEEALRKEIPVPVDEPGHVGQAAHKARNEKIQAQVDQWQESPA